ncbi:hypothetical protein NCS55_00764300 [Fusarium keratoplasticum]|nr:hypothetical protein NCS55_00764300 [Fusarium keratoplasticum]
MGKTASSHVENVDMAATRDVEAVAATLEATNSMIHVSDPLNMKLLQKLVILLFISLFSTLGLSLVGGFGGLLNIYIPTYAATGKGDADITAFMTYPTLTMGVGNLLGMPLAITIGRRSVLLLATGVMLVSATLYAAVTDYGSHLAARMVLGLAAAQSEALILLLPSGGTGFGAALCGFPFALALFFVPETKYYRPSSSYQEDGSSKDSLHPADGADPNAFSICVERPPWTWSTSRRELGGPTCTSGLGGPSGRRGWTPL